MEGEQDFMSLILVFLSTLLTIMTNFILTKTPIRLIG